MNAVLALMLPILAFWMFILLSWVITDLVVVVWNVVKRGTKDD